MGVYRIRRPGENRLVYIGQGIIRSRLANHVAKSREPTKLSTDGGELRRFAKF